MGAPATFVHDLGDHQLTDPGTVVALTAMAFEACSRAGLSPTVLDDLTQRPELCEDPTEYQRWQLDWLTRLDATFQCNGVVRSCAQLIVPAIDAIVITGRMLTGAIEALAPGAITYVGTGGPGEVSGYHNGHLQFWPRLGDVPLAARLLDLIASQCSVPFTRLPVDPMAPTAAVRVPLHARMRRYVPRSLGPYRRVYRRHRARGADRLTTLMLWYSGYGAEQFADDEHRAGRDTAFITRGGSAFRVIDPAVPPHATLGRRIGLIVRPVSALAPAAVPFLDEIDARAGVPGAGHILASRLAVFLHGICPTVAVAARRTVREFPRFKISRLAAANPSSLEEFACLVAAKSAGISRVLIQHGDHLLSYSSWLITQTGDFDEFAATDPSMQEELGTAAARLGVTAPQVFYYAPRIASLRRTITQRRRPSTASPRKVCYVPCFLLGDSRYVGACNFDDAWYHRWHRRLLDLMASRPDCRFIWKGLPSSDQLVDPIPDLITERGYSNVAYESRPLLDVIADVDQVFTDYPSTALYEAVHLRKPILAVVFSRFCAMRPHASARFAPVLRPCDTEEEALAQISQFLEGEADDWLVPERNLATPSSREA